jgi:hypothetical protein
MYTKSTPSKHFGEFLSLGLALGAGVGALFDNKPISAVLGLTFGIALGNPIEKTEQKRSATHALAVFILFANLLDFTIN